MSFLFPINQLLIWQIVIDILLVVGWVQHFLFDSIKSDFRASNVHKSNNQVHILRSALITKCMRVHPLSTTKRVCQDRQSHTHATHRHTPANCLFARHSDGWMDTAHSHRVHSADRGGRARLSVLVAADDYILIPPVSCCARNVCSMRLVCCVLCRAHNAISIFTVY